jgi:hypothetical protein
LQQVGHQEKTTSTGGRQPTPEQGDDIMLDAVTGNDVWAGLAGTIEDFTLLLSQKPSGAGWGYLFF